MSNIIVDKLGYISYFTFFKIICIWAYMKETTPSSLWPDYLCTCTLIYLYQDRFQWPISEVSEKYALPCILKHDTYEIDTCYL